MSSRQQEATAAEGHWGTAPCSRQDRPDRHCLEELLGLEELEELEGRVGRVGPGPLQGCGLVQTVDRTWRLLVEGEVVTSELGN